MTRLFLLLGVALALHAQAATPLEDATREDPAMESLAHRSAVAALMGDVGGLDDALIQVRRIDDARREQDLAPSGLRDDVQLLAAALRPTRDARRDALHAVVDAHPDAVVERLAQYAIDHEDDAGAAGTLLDDDRHNRRATVVNDAIRPLGIFSGAAVLAALNPFILAGSAVDSLTTTAINLYHYNDLSPREREALVRYRRQLARDPNTTAAPDILEVVRDINARRNKALCADTVSQAKRALDGGDLDRARFFVASADGLDGCHDATERVGERLQTALAASRKLAEAARWPADDVTPPGGDERDAYGAVAVATVLGDPARMMSTAQAFTERYPDSPQRAPVTLVVAVARDLAGHRDGAESALHQIAGRRTGAGRVASAMLETPRFGRLDPLASAERRHAREIAEYVVVGGSLDGRSVLYSASQFGAQGVAAAESLGLFNVIGMLTRAWGAWRKDPASNQAIIDEGERFLAEEPNAAEAAEVHDRLAEAYERAGIYDRALLHYKMVANPDPKRIAALEEEVANRLLENAGKAGGEPALLAAVVQHYPMTDAAEKARAALKALPHAGDIPLKRELLTAHPDLLGPTALDIGPELLDGKLQNGELADSGVVVSPQTLTLKLLDPDGGDDRSQSHPLTREAYLRARAAAEEALYASALTTDPDAGEVGRFERYIPFFIAGSVDEGGVSVAPGVKLHRDRSDDRPLYE